MENLLEFDLIQHYNLPAVTVTNWFIKTAEVYFEIEDTNAGVIVLHTNRGLGMGKFSNRDGLDVTIINYDKFITSIQDQPFKNNRKRCDILLASANNRYLILGELKDRNISKTVRKIAKKQLLSSLQTMLAVPPILNYSTQKAVKRCCYFNKQSASPATLTATTAFNRLPNIYPDGFKMSNPDIEALDFDFYEYTGAQTMALMN
jgi:hypothetical protein